MNSNKLMVKIGGSNYTVISEKSNEEIEKIANFVDGEIKKITDSNYRLNPIMASTLVALNLAENLFDLKSEIEKFSDDLDYPIKKQEEMNDKNISLINENTKLKENIDLLNSKLNDLVNIIENINARYESLEKVNNENIRKSDLKSNEIIKLQKEIIKLKEENIFIQKNLINKLNKL